MSEETPLIRAIRAVADRNETFTTDEVWRHISAYYPDAIPRDGRALGGAMLTADRLGIATPLDEWRNSTNRTCHTRPKRIWRSLTYTPRR